MTREAVHSLWYRPISPSLLSRCTPSSPVLRFPCIRLYVTRGNEEGSCFLEKRPEQEDTISSPSSSVELKFKLDTQLTVTCVVAVASAYGLLTVSIAIDSLILAFGNTVIRLLILFVLFGWREISWESSAGKDQRLNKLISFRKMSFEFDPLENIDRYAGWQRPPRH